MSDTLGRSEIYNAEGGLIHGRPFQLLSNFTPSEQGGVGEWLIGDDPQIAAERSLPFSRVFYDESGNERYRVVEVDEWEPFAGHFPATEHGTATPVVPGVYSLALAGNRGTSDTSTGLVRIDRDLAKVDKVRWKLPFFPNDTAEFQTDAAGGVKPLDSVFKFVLEEQEQVKPPKPAVEISGLETTNQYDDLVSSFALVELASHAAGLAIDHRLRQTQGAEMTDKGKPAFLGLDNLTVLGRLGLASDESVRVEAAVLRARSRTSTASVIITAEKSGVPSRTLLTIGSLLFGFSDFS